MFDNKKRYLKPYFLTYKLTTVQFLRAVSHGFMARFCFKKLARSNEKIKIKWIMYFNLVRDYWIESKQHKNKYNKQDKE